MISQLEKAKLGPAHRISNFVKLGHGNKREVVHSIPLSQGLRESVSPLGAARDREAGREERGRERTSALLVQRGSPQLIFCLQFHLKKIRWPEEACDSFFSSSVTLHIWG